MDVEMKAYIRKEIENIPFMFFHGTINSIIEKLKDLKTKYESLGFKNIEIVDDNFYDGTSFVLYGDRLETDKELEKRLKKEQKLKELKRKQKVEKELKEKELFNKLNQKYGR